MNIQTRRENLIEWMAGLNDLTLIARLEEIARSHQPQVDQWDQLPKEVQEGIQKGHQDYLDGRVIPHEEAMARVKKKVGY